MSLDIWTQCAPKFKFTAYLGKPWRVVEAQHIVATRKLVDSDEEQAILEELIDKAKPPLPYPRPHDEECKRYHYLLWTPFRYPPLKHGSRLGSSDRRGLWYGSEKIETAFAEKAYYAFLFRSGSHADFGVFETSITVFAAQVKTKSCADLTRAPFNKFEKDLVTPNSYTASQRIGSELRDRGAEVIRFKSARCAEHGFNIAVTKISAFQARKPVEDGSWFCISSADTVEFKPFGLQAIQVPTERTVFRCTDFELGGKIDFPRLARPL